MKAKTHTSFALLALLLACCAAPARAMWLWLEPQWWEPPHFHMSNGPPLYKHAHPLAVLPAAAAPIYAAPGPSVTMPKVQAFHPGAPMLTWSPVAHPYLGHSPQHSFAPTNAAPFYLYPPGTGPKPPLIPNALPTVAPNPAWGGTYLRGAEINFGG
eukprot:PLAT8608.2.p2 GENE.PLAT8608.2~~PLAT8608.2.p2  ORF type:complete len:156 (+),score=32.03 PLAT8608.2:1-468(+)